jgi:cobalamin synthase
LLIAYGSAGAIAVLSALLARAEMLASIREALLESLVASIGLLYLAFARPISKPDAGVSVATNSNNWLAVAGTPIVIAFLLLMGPGFRAS